VEGLYRMYLAQAVRSVKYAVALKDFHFDSGTSLSTEAFEKGSEIYTQKGGNRFLLGRRDGDSAFTVTAMAATLTSE